MNAPASTRPPREGELPFEISTLTNWWRENVGPAEALSLHVFRGGQSNPTYWVHDGKQAFVLRKKPPGKLLPSAHAVEREARVTRALQSTNVPVAKVVAECTDESVVGTPFFVMEHVDGRVFWNVQIPDESPATRAALYDELARVLAALHSVDPASVGLGDYGKVGKYVERQVRRWSKQYVASKTDELPDMDALMRYLPENIPDSERTTLVHGDYRLDNLIFDKSEPKALALIDWELSTLGHPLADVAYACMLYEVTLPKIGGLLGVDFEASGIPRESEFVDAYRRHGGVADESDFVYFKAFSLFRLAAIAQGVYKRSLQGNASGEGAHMFQAAVRQLSSIAVKLVGA